MVRRTVGVPIEHVSHDPMMRLFDHSTADAGWSLFAKSPQCVTLRNQPPQLCAGSQSQGISQHRQPQVIASSKRANQTVIAILQLLEEHFRQVFHPDAIAFQHFAISLFREISLAAEYACPLLGRFVERQILERVQSVVMYEDG